MRNQRVGELPIARHAGINRKCLGTASCVYFGRIAAIIEIVTADAGDRVAGLHLKPVVMPRADSSPLAVKYLDGEGNISRDFHLDRAVGFHRCITDDFAHATVALQAEGSI